MTRPDPLKPYREAMLKREALARLTQSDGQLRAHDLAAAARIRNEIIISLESELSRLHEALAKAEAERDEAMKQVSIGINSERMVRKTLLRTENELRLCRTDIADTYKPRAVSAEALLAEAGEALSSWNNLVKVAPIDGGIDPLEGIPDSHLYELAWADDDDVKDVKTITAGQIRRARSVLARLKQRGSHG